MLSRKKPATEPTVQPATGTKGRPTPKRRVQEAANRRPLVADGKAATAEQKAARRAGRAKAREGLMRGDERYLGPRDKGPMRRFMRDAVDRRWNIGEVLLPAMLIILALSLIPSPWARTGMFLVAYGLIIGGLLDGYLLWRRTKARAATEFGEEPGRGAAMYVVLRAFQMRMSRVPRPQVSRGEELRRR